VAVTLAGNGVAGFAEGQGTLAQFAYPVGVACDPLENIYVAVAGRVRKISPTGLVSTVLGSGIAGAVDGVGTNADISPVGLALSRAGGQLFIADSFASRFRAAYLPSAGNTACGAGSVGGVATLLCSPCAVGTFCPFGMTPVASDICMLQFRLTIVLFVR